MIVRVSSAGSPVAAPGAVLQNGQIAGVWTARARGQKLDVRASLWRAPDAALEKLGEKYAWSYWARVDGFHSAIRLCTSWATTDENVDALCADIAAAMR